HSPYLMTLSATPSSSLLLILPRPPPSTLFPYTTLFRSLLSSLWRAGLPLPQSLPHRRGHRKSQMPDPPFPRHDRPDRSRRPRPRSEEHTSELQSLTNLVCRLLLEKKNTNNKTIHTITVP